MSVANYKILLVGNSARASLNFRGALISYLLKKGHRVKVLCPRDCEESCARLTMLGAEVGALPPFRGSKNLFMNALAVLMIFKSIFIFRPQRLFLYGGQVVVLALLFSFLFRLKTLCFITGQGETLGSQGSMARLNQKIIKILGPLSPSTFVFLNHADTQLFLPKLEAQIVVIDGEGINSEHFMELPFESRGALGNRFVYIGRLLKSKGLLVLAQALRQLQGEGFQITCSLVGALDPSNPESLTQAELNALLQEGLFDWKGAFSDIRPALQKAEVLILPSFSEGFPRVLLEAAAVGRPFLCSDIPGCREIAKYSPRNCVFDPHSPQNMAQKIKEFHSLEGTELLSLGKVLRTAVEQHLSDQVILPRIAELFDDRA